ncbi:winged helix-turn-helix domain-containing protein [Geoglobus acetivorans]|uniref:winged helix-turn-helix domain-containing protein n=1 Tax=Geoglobus acetivorans TaxID=565033 RepID=UPI00064EE306
MPKREKKGLIDYLDTYALRILKSIAEGENSFYSEIMEKSGLVRSNFNRRLNELLNLKLVKVEYVKDPNPNVRRPRALYSLTETGKRILELLEEIERVYKSGVSEDEKFEREAEELLYDEK